MASLCYGVGERRDRAALLELGVLPQDRLSTVMSSDLIISEIGTFKTFSRTKLHQF